jgi:hypothetical protein
MPAMSGLGVELLAVAVGPRAWLAAMAAITGLTDVEVRGVVAAVGSKLGGLHSPAVELGTRAGVGTGVGMGKGKGSPKPADLGSIAADTLDDRGVLLQQAGEPVARV